MHIVKRVVLIGLALVVVIQLVPYGRDHSNPPSTREAPIADVAAKRLVVAACYDCHSNRTNWRWYSFVAPASWNVENHVKEGRRKLNFSEWDRPQETDDMVEAVREGSMPPLYYRLLHGSARLSTAEKAKVIAALRALPRPGS